MAENSANISCIVLALKRFKTKIPAIDPKLGRGGDTYNNIVTKPKLKLIQRIEKDRHWEKNYYKLKYRKWTHYSILIENLSIYYLVCERQECKKCYIAH